MSAFSADWREELRTALRFLTRLPLRHESDEAAPSLAASCWAFPVAGVVVGVVGGIVFLIAAAVGLPSLAAALLAVGATALATGGLHEDGLADTVDGFGGGASRTEKLAIMRDSRIGAYGVLALLFSVALRVAALVQIGDGWHALGALIAAHAVTRGFLPQAMRLLEPVRADGLGAMAGRPTKSAAAWASGIGAIVALLAVGLRPGLTAAIAAAVTMVVIGWIARRQIGGQTGDVLGAIEQGGEIAALLGVAIWAG
jgi:adenosylcobinamide-GDP ribazoletransferase